MMASFPPPALRELAHGIARLLRERQQTVSIAETSAGGLISASLLSVPGASEFYVGGVTIYTLESRIAFAGWTEDDFRNYKGPTPEVVAGLAAKVREKLGSTYTLCESGTAGPADPAAFSGEPSARRKNLAPGYAALAIASGTGIVGTREIATGCDNRAENMVAFAEGALQFLWDSLCAEDDKIRAARAKL